MNTKQLRIILAIAVFSMFTVHGAVQAASDGARIYTDGQDIVLDIPYLEVDAPDGKRAYQVEFKSPVGVTPMSFQVYWPSVREIPLSGGSNGDAEPLKVAKLIIEHNATDEDTGFQGFVDGEGWENLVFTGPDGPVLEINGLGALGSLGLTELFFETVEPENADVSIAEMLTVLPAANYTIQGTAMEYGESEGTTSGSAWLTHAIPAGAVLLSPEEDAEVSADEDLVVSWSPVTQTIDGADVNIIAYELIVEKDEEPHPHMMGKRKLDMYLPSSVTSIRVPKGFLEPGTEYEWEVLAIEESGNQTLSSSSFETE